MAYQSNIPNLLPVVEESSLDRAILNIEKDLVDSDQESSAYAEMEKELSITEHDECSKIPENESESDHVIQIPAELKRDSIIQMSTEKIVRDDDCPASITDQKLEKVGKRNSVAVLPPREIIPKKDKNIKSQPLTAHEREILYRTQEESKLFAHFIVIVTVFILAVCLLAIVTPQYTGVMVFWILIQNFFTTFALLYWFFSKK